MPAEFTFFVREDFDEHEQWLLDTCIHALGVLLSHVEFEQTPAPLGEGENTIIACVKSTEPVTYVTSEKMRALEDGLRERFGILSVELESTCPACKKKRYRHHGYFPDSPHDSLNMCSDCGMKAYKKRERRKKLTCPTCGANFTEEANGSHYNMGINFWLDDGAAAAKRIAKMDHFFSKFHDVAFCSARCMQVQLDTLVEELATISNQLTAKGTDNAKG